MDRNEALKMLNGLAETFDRVVPALSKDFRDAVEAMKDDRSPIKLDRSRWSGCEKCFGYACDRCLHFGEYTICEVYEKCDYFEISQFCKQCGRPLTDEAWVELERRINGGTADAER